MCETPSAKEAVRESAQIGRCYLASSVENKIKKIKNDENELKIIWFLLKNPRHKMAVLKHIKTDTLTSLRAWELLD